MTHRCGQIDTQLLDAIRGELKELHTYLLTDSVTTESIGLYNGLSGLCLYLYHNYKMSQNEVALQQLYVQLDKLLETIFIAKDISMEVFLQEWRTAVL